MDNKGRIHGVLAVDLIKSSRKNIEANAIEDFSDYEIKNMESLPLYSFGYYDTVILRKIMRPSHFYTLISKTQVDTERVLLLPCTGEVLDWNKSSFGVISFLILHEESERQIWSLGSSLHEKLQGKTNITYCSTGASAIASICLFDNPEKIAEDIQQYFGKIQAFMDENDECVYSFSSMLMNPTVECKSESLIPGIYITLSKNQHGKDFEDMVFRIAGQLSGSTIQMGSVTGSDDYYISAKDVEAQKFYALSKKIRDLGVGGKSPFDSTFTTLLVHSDLKDYQENLKNYMSWRCPIIDDISYLADDEYKKIESYIKSIENNSFLIDLRCRLNEFLELRNSPYTGWVFEKYKSVVALFTDLLKEQWDSYVINDEADSFFRSLSGMLESLLNTSAYFTNSPGYRKVDHNSIPRIIVIYQHILNQLIEQWDEYTREYEIAYAEIKSPPERIHRVLLSVKNGLSLEASMYFRGLPPDRRIISVGLPLFQAFQPVMVIPKLIHEAGHYLGVRNRHSTSNESHKNRFEYYAKISLNNFMVEFMDCYRKSFSINDSQNKADGRNLELFLSYVYDYLYEGVVESYQLYKEIKLRDVSDERLQFAIQQDYFAQMKGLMDAVYRGLLTHNLDVMLGLLNDFLNVMKRKSTVTFDHFAPVHVRLQEKFLRIWDRMREEYENDKLSFLNDAENVLSEVAADVFMVKVCGLNANQYAFLIYEDYLYSNFSKGVLFDIKNDKNVVTRIVSVFSLLPKGSPEINKMERKRLEEVKIILEINEDDDGRKLEGEYSEYKKWLIKCKEELLNPRINAALWKKTIVDYINPWKEVFDYARSIFQDIRYDEKGSQSLSFISEQRDILWESIRKMKKLYNDLEKSYLYGDTLNLIKSVFDFENEL